MQQEFRQIQNSDRILGIQYRSVDIIYHLLWKLNPEHEHHNEVDQAWWTYDSITKTYWVSNNNASHVQLYEVFYLFTFPEVGLYFLTSPNSQISDSRNMATVPNPDQCIW